MNKSDKRIRQSQKQTTSVSQSCGYNTLPCPGLVNGKTETLQPSHYTQNGF